MSGQRFTGLPMNHSWTVAILLMDAGGVKDTTKQKFKGINGTFPNRKYFYEWKSNEILKRLFLVFHVQNWK